MSESPIYDRIGTGYATKRQPEPSWNLQIRAALGPAHKVPNIGAGTGNYEPPDCSVIALEPSSVMADQRVNPHPVVRGPRIR